MEAAPMAVPMEATPMGAAPADGTAQPGASGVGGKRGPPMSREEGIKKIRRTVGWYNHNGNLAGPIHYRTIQESFESLNPREALKILNELEEKGSQIRDPTAWLKRAAENKGPELDQKVRRTIAWYNRTGLLQEPIMYDEVREALSWLAPGDACRLLAGLEGKESEIKKPTAWLCKAARNKLNRDNSYTDSIPTTTLALKGGESWKGGGGTWKSVESWNGGETWKGGNDSLGGDGGKGGIGLNEESLDAKVRKTIGWYNKSGCLQAEIRYDEVAPLLLQVGMVEASKILDGLDPANGGGAKIKNPTGWIKKAVQNLTG